MIQNRTIAIGNLYYWLITNFICWIYWYQHDVSGLALCYYMAIPFYFTALAKTWAIIRAIEMIINLLTKHMEDGIIYDNLKKGRTNVFY